MQIASVTKIINFECGCIARYSLRGYALYTKEWYIQPCFKHADKPEEIQKFLDDKLAVIREIINEEEAVAFLNEKGYIITTGLPVCRTP